MKKIGIHLAVMVGIVVVLGFGVLKYLNVYTKHNSPLVKIENLEGLHVEDAMKKLEEVGLEGVVTDTIYKDGASKESVINQNPAEGLEVKLGRKVYLVINTNKVPMVKVPDLAEKTSLPQATSMLLRRHLKVGKIIKRQTESVKTRSDEPVLAQYKAGTTEEIKAGTMIPRNSAVDLVVGVSLDYYDVDSTAMPLNEIPAIAD